MWVESLEWLALGERGRGGCLGGIEREHGAQGAFVWPPRRDAVAGGDGLDAPAEFDAGGGVGEAPGGSDERGAGLSADGARRVWTPLGGWRLLERACLGGALPGLPLGWTPEPVDSACWRCGGTVGFGEVNEKGCGACRGKRLAWDRAVRLGAYGGGLREGVIGCKYRGDRESGIRLGRMLGARVAEALIELGDRLTDRDRGGAALEAGSVVVVPVPTTYRRRRVNAGVDHALRMRGKWPGWWGRGWSVCCGGGTGRGRRRGRRRSGRGR